eukprot:NODE_4975_length_435_cov_31.051813_g4311_i0.p3 GENE.NODE_4975_length_435_cov_31.051813_g4311_i0~~NODE_4975_length_435_cov_31.051813_g4311_i0.p3  ORF type:complete len:66 (-),score=3.70 NODE_4975_length_435_cov_31.051813_g4311_i0:58-255(-)
MSWKNKQTGHTMQACRKGKKSKKYYYNRPTKIAHTCSIQQKKSAAFSSRHVRLKVVSPPPRQYST